MDKVEGIGTIKPHDRIVEIGYRPNTDKDNKDGDLLTHPLGEIKRSIRCPTGMFDWGVVLSFSKTPNQSLREAAIEITKKVYSSPVWKLVIW